MVQKEETVSRFSPSVLIQNWITFKEDLLGCICLENLFEDFFYYIYIYIENGFYFLFIFSLQNDIWLES